MERVTIILSAITTLATFIGGIFAYFKFQKKFKQLIKEYETKKSIEEGNHRQIWINEFRDEISSYFSAANSILHFKIASEVDFDRFTNMWFKIQLRLNPNNKIDKQIENELATYTNNIMFLYYFLLFKDKDKAIDELQYCDDLFILIKDYEIYKIYVSLKNKINFNIKEEYENGEMYEVNHNTEDDYKQFDRVLDNLCKTIEGALCEEIKKHRQNILLDIRAYLKTEWERIKFLINNTDKKFIFEEKFEEIKENINKKPETM